MDSINGHHDETIDLAPLQLCGPVHLGVQVYSDRDLETQGAGGGPTPHVLRSFGALSGSASGYVGVVPQRFTLAFDVLEAGSAMADYTLTQLPAED